MKTFNDLKEGDYIYKLDTFSGNVDYLKISKIITFSLSNFITIRFNGNTGGICFPKNVSFKTIFGVIYFCNQKDLLDRSFKLMKYHQTILKRIKQNIQKLKEI